MTFTPAADVHRTTTARPDRTNRLGRTGAWCYDHRQAVLLGWIVGVIVVIAVASTIGPRFENDFGASASPSKPRPSWPSAFRPRPATTPKSSSTPLGRSMLPM
jgi:hypothetical protein